MLNPGFQFSQLPVFVCVLINFLITLRLFCPLIFRAWKGEEGGERKREMH